MRWQGMRVAVLTVSDSCSESKRQDKSGEDLVDLLEKREAVILRKEIVPDEKTLIKSRLKSFCDDFKVDLVLSCGGTGFGPRDVTPEATKAVIEKEVCGLPELIRCKGMKKTKRAVLSRGVAGIRGKTLIVNLPGSPKAAKESFEAIAEIIPHALAMIRGEGHDECAYGS